MAERTHVVERDGRSLRLVEGGDRNGLPVFVQHGTPGSALLYPPDEADAAQRGIRLITYARPGYGGSDSDRGRNVADAAGDVAAIADALGCERFGTYGASGGGPHVLACAALLPNRVVGAVTIASVAPFAAEGLDWLAGRGQSNIDEIAAAQEGRDALERFATYERDQMIAADPAAMVEAIRSLVSPPDAAGLSGELGEYLLLSLREGVTDSVEGWLDDDYAFLAPWRFDLDAIRVPLVLWHGEQDLFVPIAHGGWLAERIPGADVRFEPEHGHVSLVVRMPEVHDWLLERF